MNKFLRIMSFFSIVSSFAVFCSSARAEQVLLEFSEGGGTIRESNRLVLNDGETASLVASSVGINEAQFKVYFPISGKTFFWMWTPGPGVCSQGLYQIAGPCEIFARSAGQVGVYSGSASFIFNKVPAASALTSNVVTLPAINGLGWTVELQQSSDLSNWSTVAPGSATGTASLQFYRVKVTQSN